MNRPLRTPLWLFTVVLLVFMPLMAASAQPTISDKEFTAQIADIDVVLADRSGLMFDPSQYAFDIDEPFQEEYIWVLAELTYSSYELILVDGPTDAQQYMDSTTPNLERFYQSWEILDQSVGVDTTWFLGEADREGRLILVYFEYQVDAFGDIDLAYMQFSSRTNFISDMQLAQRGLTVGGHSVPLNPDRAAISDIVGMPFLEEGMATPVSDAGDRWTELGLEGEDTWVSPTFGTSLEWYRDLWRFPFNFDSAIYVSPDGWDALTLLTTDGRGYVRIYIYKAGEDTPETVLREWEHDEYPAVLESDFVILDLARTQTSASVAYTTRSDDDREIFVVLNLSFRDDGTVIYTELTTTPESMAETYAHYADGVQVDGGTLDLTWDAEHIASLAP